MKRKRYVPGFGALEQRLLPLQGLVVLLTPREMRSRLKSISPTYRGQVMFYPRSANSKRRPHLSLPRPLHRLVPSYSLRRRRNPQ